MKKIIIFVMLVGSSISSFAGSSLKCTVTDSSGLLEFATSATVTIKTNNNVLIFFTDSQLTRVSVIAETVTETATKLKIVRKGPDVEKRTFVLDKTNNEVRVELKDNTFLGFGGHVYASAEMKCD